MAAEDCAGPEEADAGHDLGGDVGGVDACVAELVPEAVGVNKRQQCRAGGYERVSAHAGELSVELALEPDLGSEQGGQRDAQQDVS